MDQSPFGSFPNFFLLYNYSFLTGLTNHQYLLVYFPIPSVAVTAHHIATWATQVHTIIILAKLSVSQNTTGII